MISRPARHYLCSFLALLLSLPAYPEQVKIPVLTTVYVQLDEEVTSRKRETSVGDRVRAHVWRDVRVDGRTVIEAGAPVFARVSKVQKSRIAGRKGFVEIEALTATGVDGEEIALDGGYDKSGKKRVGAVVASALIVAWPLVFIKGKNAVLEKGIIFDCFVQGGASVELVEDSVPVLKIQEFGGLSVAVLYEEIVDEKKKTQLPLEIVNCEGPLDLAAVVTVNEKPIEAIPLTLDESTRSVSDECQSVVGKVMIRKLSEHFTRGINRFEVEVGEVREEVVLEIEY